MIIRRFGKKAALKRNGFLPFASAHFFQSFFDYSSIREKIFV
jgi:hypothetical protein